MPEVTTQRFDDFIREFNGRELAFNDHWSDWAIRSDHSADTLPYIVSTPTRISANIPVFLSHQTQTSTSDRKWVVSTGVKVENYAQLLRQLADEIDLGYVKVAYGRFYDNGRERLLNIKLEKQEWTSAK